MRTPISNLRKHKLLMGVVWIGGFLIVALFGLVAYRLISGEPLGLRSAVEHAIYNTRMQLQVIQDSEQVKQYSTGEYTNVLFLHHSVGEGIIKEGDLRGLMQDQGLVLFDQNYNYIGLTDPTGSLTGTSYIVPDDNTDPDGLAKLFSESVYGTPVNALSAMMQHEVIMMKSCYPANEITSDEELQEIQNYYLQVRSVIEQHPDKLFILLTTPPLIPTATTSADAMRAREISEWLQSETFKNHNSNLYVFDLYGALAEGDSSLPDYNTLKAEYRRGGDDAHPNEVANQTMAPEIAQFVVESIQRYRSDQ